MNCTRFPDRPAAGICAYSGKPYCAEELVEVEGKYYGRENLGRVMADIKEQAAKSHSPVQPMVFMNAGGASSSSAVGGAMPFRAVHSRGTAAILALLLGGIGAHKFYLGQTFQGLIYLVFCWTFIPAILGLLEAVCYLTMTEQFFAQRYG